MRRSAARLQLRRAAGDAALSTSRAPRGLQPCQVPGCFFYSRLPLCPAHRVRAVIGPRISLAEAVARLREDRERRRDDACLGLDTE